MNKHKLAKYDNKLRVEEFIFRHLLKQFVTDSKLCICSRPTNVFRLCAVT